MIVAKCTFLTEREIIDDLMTNLSTEDKKVLRKDSKEELIKYHHQWGKHISNFYNMWMTENPYVVHGDSMHENFPDQISGRVIEGVWELLQITK